MNGLLSVVCEISLETLVAFINDLVFKAVFDTLLIKLDSGLFLDVNELKQELTDLEPVFTTCCRDFINLLQEEVVGTEILSGIILGKNCSTLLEAHLILLHLSREDDYPVNIACDE